MIAKWVSLLDDSEVRVSMMDDSEVRVSMIIAKLYVVFYH